MKTPPFESAITFDAHTHSERRNALIDLDPVDLTARQATGAAPYRALVEDKFLSRLRRACSLSSVAFTPAFRLGFLYSVGIHPWNYRRVTPAALRLLRALAAEPQVRAIGECGLDPLVQVPRQQSCAATHPQLTRAEILRDQTRLLHFHFELSERLGKPLLLHIVRAFPEIIALRRQWRPSQPWIIHGFRGKPQLARELLAHGFHLSYGLKYNPESFALTPPGRSLRETDDARWPLR